MSDTLDIPGAEGLCRTFADAMEVGDMDGRYVAQSEARAMVAYVNGLRDRIADLENETPEQVWRMLAGLRAERDQLLAFVEKLAKRPCRHVEASDYIPVNPDDCLCCPKCFACEARTILRGR